MAAAMVFKYIVERPKSHSGFGIATGPHNIILGCIILHFLRLIGFSLCLEDIVDDSQDNFVRTDIVKGKYRMDL